MSDALLPDTCIGCSACVAACPVFAADGGFAGPKVVGPAFARRREGGWPGEPYPGPAEAAALGADLCLRCHACDLACPAGIAVSALTGQAKTLAAQTPQTAFRRFSGRLLADQERFGHLVSAAGAARRLGRCLAPRLALGLERMGLRVLGLSPNRSLPAPPRLSLPTWLESTRRPEVERTLPSLILFAGCHARLHDPRVGQAAVSVLRAAGYRVALPTQVCCGSPASSSGEEELAAQAARANVALLGQASTRLGEATPIVSPCPSCTLALRRTLPELVPGQAARQLASRVWDLGEFLAGPAESGLHRALERTMKRTAERSRVRTSGPFAYHTPCHLQALGSGRPFPALLGALGSGTFLDPGPAADGCCGMGGLAGLTAAGYRRSLATGRPVLEAYATLEPALILSDCPACRWQIADATGRDTAHPVEVLAAALAGPDSPRRPLRAAPLSISKEGIPRTS